MNGGVLHSIESTSEGNFGLALEGYRFFGFDPVSGLLQEIRARLDVAELSSDEEEALERESDSRYDEYVDDERIFRAFTDLHHADPQLFSSVDQPGLVQE